MKELKHKLRCHQYLEKELRKKRSLEKKLEVINKALKKHPEDEAELLFETGAAYIHFYDNDVVNRFKTGRQYYKKALALTSDANLKAVVYWRLALSYSLLFGEEETADADKEIKYLLLANKLVPEDLWILRGIGEAYLQKKDYKNAEIYFKQVHKLNPNDAVALYQLGTFELNKNNISAAIKYYNVLFKKKRHLDLGMTACSLLAAYYRARKDFKSELFYFKKAYKICPYTGACFDLGNYYLRFDEEQEAHRYYYEGVLDHWRFFKIDKDLNEILFSTLEEINETIEYFMNEYKKPSFPIHNACILYTLFKLNESINKKAESTAWFMQFLNTQKFDVALMVTDKGPDTLLN